MNNTKKPAPSQQESSATTAKKCNCPGDYAYYNGGEPHNDWCPASSRFIGNRTLTKLSDHPNPAPPEAKPCDDGKEENTPEPQSGLDDVIAVYGDLLFAGIEAAAGLQIWLWEALSSTGVAALKESIGALRNEINKPDTGVLPLVPLTPEERAQDQAEWRARVRASIEETQRQKAAEGEATK